VVHPRDARPTIILDFIPKSTDVCHGYQSALTSSSPIAKLGVMPLETANVAFSAP
jgi:hypothetical protein